MAEVFSVNAGSELYSTSPYHIHREQGAELGQPSGDVADADRTVVGWTLGVPAFDKSSCTDGKAVTTVGVADLQDGSGHRLALGHQKFQGAIGILHHGEQGDRSVTDTHLHGETFADLAVVDLQRADLGFA